MEILYFSPRMYDLLKEKVGPEPIEFNLRGLNVMVMKDPNLHGNSLQAEGDLAEMLHKMFLEALLKIER